MIWKKRPIEKEIAALNSNLMDAQGAIAYIETGVTAHRNYAKGDFLLWNGTLYTFNQNVSSGVSLSGFVTAVGDKGGLNALNSKLIPQKIISEPDATTSRTLYIPGGARVVIDFITNNSNSVFSTIISSNSSGTVFNLDKCKGSAVTIDTSANNRLTITTQDSRQGTFFITANSQNVLNVIDLV